MSELQEGQAAEQEIIEQQQSQQPDNGNAELAPASEGKHEENNQASEELSANAQKVINKKHWEAKEAERQAAEYKRQLEELQSQQRTAQNAEPIVPPMPDAFEDNFEQLVSERDKKIMERAQWQANQNAQQQQQQQIEQQQLQEQQQKIYQSVQTYEERAKGFGIDKQELEQVGNLVSQSGISLDLQMELLNDPDGALIVKHLASDIQSLDQLTKMTPYQAANFINQKVRPQAINLKPKTSNTPPPPDNLSGGNVDIDAAKYGIVAGAKFE